MRPKFYICAHCGNIIALIRDKGVPVYCCNEPMRQITPNTTDASSEKHCPTYEVDGHTVHVRVGATPHPMTEEHYIEWICLETAHGIQFVHLTPKDAPSAVFSLCDGDEVCSVYAFCNQHNLWRE